MRDSFWLQGMLAGFKGVFDCIKAFSETDFTEDLKKFDVPTLILHGDDDQIVPIGASALISSKLVKDAQLEGLQGCTARHVFDPQGRNQRGPARVPQGVGQGLTDDSGRLKNSKGTGGKKNDSRPLIRSDRVFPAK